ncbi:FumA C-terminus/TtdB family hydratase beta subunit [Provencibacterium massiliense]|uniref:FumA C-terminus/TtdB family hydratase beta subunit n=1 Tax=Provencibacterium massiliense TaxID=1841868 RepID=UPI000E3FE88B|nr:HAD family hydrolase [Harryflintia acetispora]
MIQSISVDNLRAAAKELRAGDRILLSGTIYTARDAAHKRIMELLEGGERSPFPLRDAVIYFAGPTAAREGSPIGSCGPTTSSRMDPFTPRLMDLGLLATIGKGERSPAVYEAVRKNGGLYLCAMGGAGALAAKCVRSCEVIAFEDLGCESIKRLEVEDFPLIVAADSFGGQIFNTGGDYELAVFDLDGTLADTLQDLADACNRALGDLGYPQHSLGEYRYFVGSGVKKLMERILPEGHRDEETLVRLNGLFDRYYEECYLRHSAPYEGVRRMLAALRGAGIKLAVLSNKPHPFTEKMVEQLFPDTFFAAFGKREGVPRKPDPTAVHEVLRLAGTGPERAVYIGDSDVDVQTGHNAGLYVIGVDWGFRGARELRQAGADRIVFAPNEIRDFLLPRQ